MFLYVFVVFCTGWWVKAFYRLDIWQGHDWTLLTGPTLGWLEDLLSITVTVRMSFLHGPF